MKRRRMQPKAGYWLRHWVGRCPRCKMLGSYSERVYWLKRPKRMRKRIKRLKPENVICGCMEKKQ